MRRSEDCRGWWERVDPPEGGPFRGPDTVFRKNSRFSGKDAAASAAICAASADAALRKAPTRREKQALSAFHGRLA